MLCSLRIGVMAFRSLGPRAAGKRGARYVTMWITLDQDQYARCTGLSVFARTDS